MTMDSDKPLSDFERYMGAAQSFLRQKAYVPESNVWEEKKPKVGTLSKQEYKKRDKKCKIEKLTRKKNRGKK